MLNVSANSIPSTKNSFIYLGSLLTPDLTNDAEIKTGIRKASTQLGILKHVFNNKRVDQRVKYWASIMGIRILELILGQPKQTAFLPPLSKLTNFRLLLGTPKGMTHNKQNG